MAQSKHFQPLINAARTASSGTDEVIMHIPVDQIIDCIGLERTEILMGGMVEMQELQHIAGSKTLKNIKSGMAQFDSRQLYDMMVLVEAEQKSVDKF